MNKKTIFAILLAGVMTASVFMGCTSSDDHDHDHDDQGTVSTPAVSNDDADVDDDADTDPSGAETVAITEEVYDKIINDMAADIFGDDASIVVGNLGAMDIDMLAERTGIDSSMVVSYRAMIPMMNTDVTELIILEVAEENQEAVKEQLEAYKTSVIANRDPEQGGFPYLADHLPKAQNAHVEIIGDVVVYYAVANTANMADDESFDDVIKADIEKAVAATKANLGVE